jgi:hypothetical protein
VVGVPIDVRRDSSTFNESNEGGPIIRDDLELIGPALGNRRRECVGVIEVLRAFVSCFRWNWNFLVLGLA